MRQSPNESRVVLWYPVQKTSFITEGCSVGLALPDEIKAVKIINVIMPCDPSSNGTTDVYCIVDSTRCSSGVDQQHHVETAHPANAYREVGRLQASRILANTHDVGLMELFILMICQRQGI